MAATDAITLLIDDHRRVDALFDEYAAARDAAVKERLVRTIMSELSIHAAVEEQFLYPVVREVVPGGADMADESLDEHQQVKDVLATLERLGVEDVDFTAQMDELVADVRHHVAEEEAELFPRLREAVGEERLREMGQAMAAGKAMAPTHPHPELPNRPPANFLVGPIAGVADRVRDGLEAFGDEGQWTELVRQGQQAVWDVVRTWADAATRGTPAMGSVSAQAQWRPDDAVERIFDFSNRLLGMQRQFAQDLLGAVSRGVGDEAWDETASAQTPTPEEAASASAPRTASRARRPGAGATAKKATAKKASAKKATAKKTTASAKRTAAKRTAATSTAGAAPADAQPAASETAAKQTAAKQTAAKQTAGKQTAAKQTAAKQTTAKQTAAKQTAARAASGTAAAEPTASSSGPAQASPSTDAGTDTTRGAGAPTPSTGAPDYAAMTVAQLRDEAKRLDVPGRTGMNKAQLVRALQQRTG